MKNGLLVVSRTAIVVTALVANSQAAGPQTAKPTSSDARTASASTQRTVLDRYCVTCHNTRSKAAGLEAARKLTLDQLDLLHVDEHADVWETVVRKLRAGMMPPSGARRPDQATRHALIAWLGGELDKLRFRKLTPWEGPTVSKASVKAWASRKRDSCPR